MRVPQGTTLALWLCVMALACLLTGCPDTAANVDAAGDVANDLGDAGIDAAKDILTQTDVSGDSRDASDVIDASDVVVPTCVPGMSIACACVDGRMGAQVCRSDFSYSPCQCTPPDAGTPDVVLLPLGARLIAPQSVSRVTSRRPTMRWVLPDGVTRARVQVCADRSCARMLMQQEVTGTSWRPTGMLAPGVAYWRVRGLDGDGGVAWSSATWEFVVGQRDAPVDTSFGTLKDFNGDGFDDVAVPSVETRGLGIVVYDGRIDGGASDPSLSIGTGRSYIYGQSVGDLNGDGFAGLASSSPQRQDGVRDEMVQVRYGSRAGLPMDPSVILRRASSRAFAQNVAIADVDGDGLSDLMVVSGNETGTNTNILVYSGSERGISAQPALVLDAPQIYYHHGARVTAFEVAGDVNLDGYADLVTSYERVQSAAGFEAGRAWIVMGHPTQSLRTWSELLPPSMRGHFGGAVAGVGDLDGDGVADFAISSDEEVSFYLGREGSVTTTPTRSIQNPEAPCYLPIYGFGSALGRAGDFDGDGRADLSVGARCLPYPGDLRFGPGSVYVYSGRSSGVTEAPVVFRGMMVNTWFGVAVGGIGDFNGDGFGDLAILQSEVGAEFFPATLYVLPGSMMGAAMFGEWGLAGTYGYFSPAIAMNGPTSRAPTRSIVRSRSPMGSVMSFWRGRRPRWNRRPSVASPRGRRRCVGSCSSSGARRTWSFAACPSTRLGLCGSASGLRSPWCATSGSIGFSSSVAPGRMERVDRSPSTTTLTLPAVGPLWSPGSGAASSRASPTRWCPRSDRRGTSRCRRAHPSLPRSWSTVARSHASRFARSARLAGASK